MYQFNFYMPTKVLFGPGRLQDLHNEQLPGKRPDRHVKRYVGQGVSVIWMPLKRIGCSRCRL